ncbi:arylsulfotransferase family protein [Halorussus salilacus]|uniref:arylsulfotransferase family protein n=1 Tax=Halorussus salilacus TaxID=2953750 RepID=UPI00209E57A8|nr:arylsulfotransferase family protein [Halorussus salilacus]USZ67341.1 arylsulfotransferase family protein [Halorussus salilacus]
MRSRDVVRLLFVGLVVAAGFVVAAGYLSSADESGSDGRPEFDAGPRDGVTVVATDSNTWLGESSEGPRARAELVAFAPNGSVLYYNDSHTRYWDVDPVPNTTRSVMYVAADHLSASECHSEEACTRNVVERANLTTGEVERIYSRVTPGKSSTRWHDADRLDDERLVVADIARDRVYVVNTTTDMIEWEWDAQRDFSLDSGGPFPEDWTHLNDVEVLDDGTVMVSMRNQDQVVFLDREEGVVENRTLGAEDDYEVLYEQHNPDYIPAEEGGPAVLVGDSENDRVVEYQRDGDSWERTWTWSDARMQWPRDADRLPNAHTLVTDSNGNRVFEVDEDGEVAWSVDIAFPYEAERLGTGDESAGGPAASEAGIESNRGGGDDGDTDAEVATADSGVLDRAWLVVEDLLPGRTANALMYVTPVWMGGPEVLAAGALAVVLLLWLLAEAYWSRWSLSVRSPVSLSRRR